MSIRALRRALYRQQQPAKAFDAAIESVGRRVRSVAASTIIFAPLIDEVIEPLCGCLKSLCASQCPFKIECLDAIELGECFKSYAELLCYALEIKRNNRRSAVQSSQRYAA